MRITPAVAALGIVPTIAAVALPCELTAQGKVALVFEGQFGTLGAEVGQLNTARSLTVDASGRIIIADSGNNRIQICNFQGHCRAFGSFGPEPGQFFNPHGVVVDAQGRIITVEVPYMAPGVPSTAEVMGNHRVQIFDSTGVYLSSFGRRGSELGQFASPGGVTVDSQDRIIVADEGNHRIQICNYQGACTAFGRQGTGLGEFRIPRHVAVDPQGQIIVTDRDNHRIQICDAAGSCTAFGSQGTAVGQFSSPSEVVVDREGRVIVADRDNHRIQVCDYSGNCQAFGEFGTGPGQFSSPPAVTVYEDRVIVSDRANARIQILRLVPSPE